MKEKEIVANKREEIVMSGRDNQPLVVEKRKAESNIDDDGSKAGIGVTKLLVWRNEGEEVWQQRGGDDHQRKLGNDQWLILKRVCKYIDQLMKTNNGIVL